MSENLQGLHDVAVNAALAAGDILREKASESRQITAKGYLDIVTDADFASDAVIQKIITEAYPHHEILSEESEEGKHIDQWQPSSNIWWCIDPIDGTNNFSRGNPMWSISIAVAQGDELLAGVVYDPLHNQLYAAAKGQGATLNGDPIHVSDYSLRWAMLGAEFPTHPQRRQRILSIMNHLVPHVRSFRAIGTTALAMAWIAAGYLDGYINQRFKPWDVAAGMLLIQEAGGVLSDLDGQPLQWKSPTLLASTPTIHQDVVDMMSYQQR